MAALLAAFPGVSHGQTPPVGLGGAPPGGGGGESDGLAELEDLVDEAGLPALTLEGDAGAAAPETQGVEEATRDLLREAAAFREHPLDVNTAALSDLLRLPFLDPAAAARVVASRERDGPFAAIGDLASRGVLSASETERVRPYLVAGPVEAAGGAGPAADAAAASGAAVQVHPPGTLWSLRLRSSAGRDGGAAMRDLGAAARTYARFRLALGERLLLGVSCEKDPGEESFLDHAAFFALWNAADGTSLGAPARLSLGVGDFSGSWGQGLVMGSGTLASSGSYPRARDRLTGYDGAGEALARRGLFVEAAKGRARVHAFAASTRLDATVADDGTVSTIRTSGLHCTDGERAGRDALRESLLGARVAFTSAGSLMAAASVHHFAFDPPFGGGDVERQHFKFRGEALTVWGADARATLGPWRFGAEGARSSQGAVAWLAAAAARVGDADLRLGAGYASRHYWAPLGRGFPGASGGTNGLSGWLRVAYGPRGRWSAWTEAVVSRRPWRSYLLELPDGALTLVTGAEIGLGRYGRAAIERRERVSAVEEGESNVTGEERTRRTTLSLATRGSPSLAVRALRIESAIDGVEQGILRALGVRFERDLSPRAAVTVGATAASERGSVRPTMTCEPGLPGEFGLSALNGSGTRWYIRVRAGVLDALGISARLSCGPERGRVELGVAIDVSQGVP